uniref:Uncharacterized protein n=1 Tax=Triticum urartu TaxID=4572 RepID=A0A8R7UBP3_TRIUA
MRSSLPDEQDVVIQKQRRGQSWYARLSDERRAEYLNKQRMAQRDKKAARTVALPQSSSPQETSLPDNDAITQHQLPEIVGDCNIRTGKGWYASLSGQRKEEHLRKLRISHKQKRAGLLDVDVNEGIGQSGPAQSQLTRVVDTPLCRPNLDEGGSADWLHSNLTYV